MPPNPLVEAHNKIYQEVHHVAVGALRDITTETSRFMKDLTNDTLYWMHKIAVITLLFGLGIGFTTGLFLGLIIGKWG